MKQLLILLFVVIAAAINCRAQITAEESTESLVRACEIAAKFPSLETLKKAPAAEQTENSFQAARCLGYFSGMLDLNSLYSGGLSVYFCSPKDLPTIEAVKVFLTYAKDNPKFAKEAARSIALSALADGMPCAR